MNRQDIEQLTIPPDGRSIAEQPRWRQDFPIDWPQAICIVPVTKVYSTWRQASPWPDRRAGPCLG